MRKTSPAVEPHMSGCRPQTIFDRMRAGCLVLLVMIPAGLLGCSATRDVTKTPRTPIEQLLVSQSIQRGLDVSAEIFAPRGSATVVADGLTADDRFVQEVVMDWLRQQGWHVSKHGEYLVHVTVYALGTEQAENFFGIPPVSGSLLPISVPELALYKASRQRGYARFALTVSETPGGRLINSTPVLEGDVYFNQYTVLFAVSFHTTDLAPPPP